MNKRILKPIMSLVLVVVMAVSTMMVSAVSTSAETANATYKFDFQTAGSLGTSLDKISIKVNGDKGSTRWHNVGYIANAKTDNASFSDIDVGTVKSVTVKNSGIDGWYPEFIKVIVNDVATTIYGNRWVDNGNEVTLSIDDKAYSFNITTAGSDGTSIDDISIKVNGDKGSTSWHDVGKVAKDKKDNCDFNDINVGAIKSITVKNSGIDGWYPEIIKITVGETTTTIFGGRWVDDKKEVTLAVTDRVAKVTVRTSDCSGAGTDADVCIKLVDGKGNETGETNLSSIHPESNAFERYDKATFYIHIPENFGKLKKIHTGTCYGFTAYDDWWLDYIEVAVDGETKVFPYNDGIYFGDEWKTLDIGYLYKVTVKTSDVKYAGTDSEVNLHTYDKNGKKIICPSNRRFGSYYDLDNSDNNFEKGDTDIFYIATYEKIADIKMEREDDLGTKWHLDYVQLDLMDGDNVVESTKYNYNQWIESYKELEPKSKEVLL